MKKFVTVIAFFGYLTTLIGQQVSCSFLEKKILKSFETDAIDSALIFAKRLENVSAKVDSAGYKIKSLFYQGKALSAKENMQESMPLLFKALKGVDSNTPARLVADIHREIAWAHLYSKNYEAANYYFLKEYQLIGVNDTGRIFKTLLNIAQCYVRQQKFDSSKYYIQRAKEMENLIKQPALRGHFYTALAHEFITKWYISRDKILLDSSLHYYLKAIDPFEHASNVANEKVMLHGNIGVIYSEKKDLNLALKHFLMANSLLEKSNRNWGRLSLYFNTAMIYDELKDYKNCSEFLWKYIDWTDTVQLQKTRELAGELDSKYKMELEAFKNDIIKNQGKIIEEKTSEIKNQNAKIYLSWALFILIIGIFVVWLIYFRLKNNSRILIDEAKKRFFTNVVHEVRTPLSMIHAPIQLLKTKATSQEDKQNIELAERNINRLNELITQMLDISKLDQEKYTLKETIGDLELFFHDVINLYTKIAMEKNIAVIPELNFIHKHAIFDKDALQKITGNLLDNAIKFTDSNNQVGISVSSEELENGTNLFIKVWDTGPGMNAYDKEQIFERFHRGQSTEHIKGMGVGLALVKELVDLMHGEISVSSDEGKGSCFEVILTLKSYTETTSEKVNSGNDDKPQVLLIEDDLEILNFNTRYLESNNLHVLKAENGKAAFKIIELNIPDIIVTDLMMQELDGIAFLKKMKSNPATEHIPVIILSAKTSSETRIEALQSGAQSFITKPYLPEELLSTVQSQLDIIKLRKVEFINQIQKPEESVEQKFRNSDPYLQKLFNFVFINLADEEFSVEKLADLMATNRSHFQRKVKALCGLSPSEIIRTVRLEKAREMILTKKSNINEVAYQTGFSSHSYFTKCFTQHFGISPTKLLQTA